MTASAESRSPATAHGHRVPDFFIVGHHKSGTTALYEMLRRHPQIFMPEVKEPRFMASDLRALVPVPPASTLPRTLGEYLSLFDPARADQLAGEASPSYLRSKTAARDIAALQPDARIVAILREPASFVRSMHLQLLQEHVELEKDLGRAIASEVIERGGQTVRRYADHVEYVEQLRRYRDVLGPERMLVLIYDDFRANNEATVRRVLRFLGVDDGVAIEPVEANPTIGVRSVRLDGAVRRLFMDRGPVSKAIKRLVRRLVPESARRGAVPALRRRVVHSGPPQVDEQVMLQLRVRFRGEVEALSEYLDRDLVKLWGYDCGG